MFGIADAFTKLIRPSSVTHRTEAHSEQASYQLQPASRFVSGSNAADQTTSSPQDKDEWSPGAGLRGRTIDDVLRSAFCTPLDPRHSIGWR